MKNIFGVALFLIVSCDKSSPLTINDGITYPLQNSCGLIEFRASTFSTGVTVYHDFKRGRYKLNVDSVKVIANPASNVSIRSITVYKENGEEITEKSIETTPGDRINLHLVLDKPVYSVNGTLLILPCSYITCFGTPLIIDTIQVQL